MSGVQQAVNITFLFELLIYKCKTGYRYREYSEHSEIPEIFFFSSRVVTNISFSLVEITESDTCCLTHCDKRKRYSVISGLRYVKSRVPPPLPPLRPE